MKPLHAVSSSRGWSGRLRQQHLDRLQRRRRGDADELRVVVRLVDGAGVRKRGGHPVQRHLLGRTAGGEQGKTENRAAQPHRGRKDTTAGALAGRVSLGRGQARPNRQGQRRAGAGLAQVVGVRSTSHAVAIAAAMSLTAGLAACRDHERAAGPVAVAEAKGLSPAVRDQAPERAPASGARRPADPATRTSPATRQVPAAFDANADVDCTFAIEPVDGSTPKFKCLLPSGERIKVKYGLPNGELPAEVAGTRLLAALGFPSDRMYKVHSVRCRGCPFFPQQALQCLARSEPAAVCLQGASVEPRRDVRARGDRTPDRRRQDRGAGRSGLVVVPARSRSIQEAGGSPRAEVDALRLVAVLLAHWDNKGANQKLICPSGTARADGTCSAPLAAIGPIWAARSVRPRSTWSTGKRSRSGPTPARAA